uniref:Uncharacterized protein n=1 Tax=Lepeophtheirus salmonis TaxID=72036 RepID=A0A0K2UHF3_LEPSM
MDFLSSPNSRSNPNKNLIENEGQSKRNKDTFCLTIREDEGTQLPSEAEIYNFHSKYLFSYCYTNPSFVLHCSAKNSDGEYWFQCSCDYNPMHLKRCVLKWGKGTYRISNPVDYIDELQRNESVNHWILTIPHFLLLQFPSVYSLIDRYVQLMSKKYRGSCIEYKILKIEESRDVHSKVLIKFDDATNDNPTYSISRINNFLTIWGHRLHLRRVSISHEILNSGKLDSIKLDDLKHTSMGYGRHDMKIEYIEGIFNL